jgi:hypothetical protein
MFLHFIRTYHNSYSIGISVKEMTIASKNHRFKKIYSKNPIV